MTNTKILVADDDPNVCEIIRLFCSKQQMDLVVANDGKQALELAEKELPDLIILDVMMPQMDGFEACREIRKKWDIPIIMLTAKDEEFDRVLGLELGADDYVTKPFSPRELLARIRAIMRRMQPREKQEEETLHVLSFDQLVIDIEKREVLAAEEKVNFRPKEFDLLVHMARSPGSVFSREQLLEQIWGFDYFGDARTIDVHIKKIRQRLQKLPYECIHTVWGIGYKFGVDEP
ncbi:response regulator transcription factor [Brevibacillus ruminantium]|uniref:Response regulator transcription factor n=1 Tax=Brevibacillus ruminantium TaxID=2950604 RepID=A0ABY4WGB2_9BACL|nr:response regulator transcription factor [Brevibacillus ruminantium]USG66200.1 response regulator transcription factor [Brevibacillus ruminantium]